MHLCQEHAAHETRDSQLFYDLEQVYLRVERFEALLKEQIALATLAAFAAAAAWFAKPAHAEIGTTAFSPTIPEYLSGVDGGLKVVLLRIRRVCWLFMTLLVHFARREDLLKHRLVNCE